MDGHFKCTICERSKMPGSGGVYGVSEPLPGEICRGCADGYGLQFSNDALNAQKRRSDFVFMRSLSAFANALKFENRK